LIHFYKRSNMVKKKLLKAGAAHAKARANSSGIVEEEASVKKQKSLADAELRRSCCLPKGNPGALECLFPNTDVHSSPDVIKFVCSNDDCQSSGLMHEKCYVEKLEPLAVMWLKQQARCRSWTVKHTMQNLWKDCGYKLIVKMFPCNCGQGFIRKHEAEKSEQVAAVLRAPQAQAIGQDVEKKLKKPKLNIDMSKGSKGTIRKIAKGRLEAKTAKEDSNQKSFQSKIPGLNIDYKPQKLNLDMTKLGTVSQEVSPCSAQESPDATLLLASRRLVQPPPPFTISTFNHYGEIYSSSTEESETDGEQDVDEEKFSLQCTAVMDNLMADKIANEIERKKLEDLIQKFEGDNETLENNLNLEVQKSQDLRKEISQHKFLNQVKMDVDSSLSDLSRHNASKLDIEKRKMHEQYSLAVSKIEKQVESVTSFVQSELQKFGRAVSILEENIESCSDKNQYLDALNKSFLEKRISLEESVRSKDNLIETLKVDLSLLKGKSMKQEMLIQSGMSMCAKKEELEVFVQMLQNKLSIVEENGKKNTKRIISMGKVAGDFAEFLKSSTAIKEDSFQELLKSNQKSEVLILDLEKKIETLTGENEEFKRNMLSLGEKMNQFQRNINESNLSSRCKILNVCNWL